MASEDIDLYFKQEQYATYLKLAVDAELQNSTPALTASVFAANVALWRLTDAAFTINRMQSGERARFSTILNHLNACAFSDAISHGDALAPHVAHAIRVGVVGKASKLNGTNPEKLSSVTRIPVAQIVPLLQSFTAATKTGWGPNTARQLAEVAAFIEVA